MAKKRAGWERILYRGTAGSTAATQVTPNVTDVDLGGGSEFNTTTTRGDGSALPKITEQVVALKAEPKFTMIYKDGDAHMVAFLAAARTGAAVALKIVRYSGGETEFDGDCYLEYSAPGPLSGGMEVEFTAHPTDDSGRDWTVGV